MKYFFAGLLIAISSLILWPIIGSTVTTCGPTPLGSGLRQISLAFNTSFYLDGSIPETAAEGLNQAGMTDPYFHELISSENFTYTKPTVKQLKNPSSEVVILTYTLPDGKYVGYLDGHVEFVED